MLSGSSPISFSGSSWSSIASALSTRPENRGLGDLKVLHRPSEDGYEVLADGNVTVEDSREVGAEGKDDGDTSSFPSERECANRDEEDGGPSPAQVGQFVRTDTGLTLIGEKEENG